MANEYEILSIIEDTQTDCRITTQRMYQENGNTGIEIVIERLRNKDRFYFEVFQAKDLVERIK